MKSSDPQAQLEQLQARNRALEAEKACLEGEANQLRAEQTRLLTLQEGLETQLRQALLELAELKRQLFGERSDQLTPEEEDQLAEVAEDLKEQAQRDPPVSDEVLADPADEESAAQDSPQGHRPRRG